MLLSYQCTKEDTALVEADYILETVTDLEALAVVSQYRNTQSMYQQRSTEAPYLTIYEQHITRVDIQNSDQMFTVLPAVTSRGNAYSRVVLLKIDGETHSAVYSLYSSNNFSTVDFNGDAVITDLEGNLVNALRVEDGNFVSRYVIPTENQSQSNALRSGSGGDSSCLGMTCGENLDEVLIVAPHKVDIIIPMLYPSVVPPPSEEAHGSLMEEIGSQAGGGGDAGLNAIICFAGRILVDGVCVAPEDLCESGFISDVLGNCIENIVVDGPDKPIEDIEDFLECFDISEPAIFTIYASEPNPGSGDTYSGNVVGHAYISIKQNSNVSTFGYYPVSNWINPITNSSGPAVLGNDGGEIYSASYTTTISGNQLRDILNSSKHFNSTYDLDTYNCTDFAIEMGNFAGLNLPNCNGSWPGGSGSNPGTLGMEIRALNTNNGNSTSSGNSSNTNKGC
jgi:hypothetical protein